MFTYNKAHCATVFDRAIFPGSGMSPWCNLFVCLLHISNHFKNSLCMYSSSGV